MWISRYVCLFMIYSFMGWVYETLFCTIKEGRWEDRGFLYGPGCPIYGTGAVTISVLLPLTLAGLPHFRSGKGSSGVRNFLDIGKSVPCGMVGLQRLAVQSSWQDLSVCQSGIWYWRAADCLCYRAFYGKCRRFDPTHRAGVPGASFPVRFCGGPYTYGNRTASF